MKKSFQWGIALIIFLSAHSEGQAQSSSFFKPLPPNYEIKRALEVESLIPMFFYGGWHAGVGYRINKFRFRVSIINGGSYNADVQSPEGPIDGYERYYSTSPGIFAGYNIWRHLEIYGYYERHTFDIQQLSTGNQARIQSNDYGIGISYPFFIGRTFYIQPGIHSYFRAEQTAVFTNQATYEIPTLEITPVIRLGARVWKK